MSYDAFVSYRHDADAALATAIEKGLERIAKPWNRLRAMSVFRDQSELGAQADLTAAITRALDDTRFLILVASRESAASPWVDKETAYWCDECDGGPRLIVVLADGELSWDEAIGALSSTSTAVSPALRSRITTEPLYVDLRWARDAPELSLRDSRFRSAMVLVAATIRGVAPADLESEDVRLHRRARRLARSALVTVAVLALAASLAAVLAVANARRAEQRARDALGRQIGLLALDMPASAADQAFLLSLVAADLDSSGGAQRFEASRALIGRYARLDTFLRAPPGTSSLRSLAMSADGERIVATVTHGQTADLVIWPAAGSGETIATPLPETFGVDPQVWSLTTGRLLIRTADGGIVTADHDGNDVITHPGVVVVDPGAGWAVRKVPAGRTELIDLGTGEVLAAADEAAGLVDLRFNRAASASKSTVLVLDGATGSTTQAPLVATDPVTAIAAGPSDELIAVTASDRAMVTWRRTGDRLVAGSALALPSGIGSPAQLVVAPDGRRILVVGTQGAAVLHAESGDVDAVEEAGTGRLAVDPSGRYAAVGGDRLTIWDLATGDATFAVPRPITAMAWSSCTEWSACRLATVGRSIDVWEPPTRSHIELLDQSSAQTVAIAVNGSTVVTGGWGTSAALWQLRPVIDDTVRTGITFDEATLRPDGTRRISWSDGIPVVEEVPTGERIDFHPRCVGDLYAVSPLGHYVVSHRLKDRRTAVCSTEDGAFVAWADLDAAGAASPADRIAVDDDGNVATAGGLGFVAYFRREGSRFAKGQAVDARRGTAPVEITALATRAGTIAAAVRPQGESAVARVLVWPFVSGATATQFESEYRFVSAVALIGDDSEHVVTAGSDEEKGAIVVQVWESRNSRRLGRALAGLSGEVVVLGGGDSDVMAADSGGRAFRWAIDQDPTSLVCQLVGRSLGADEWEELAGGALSSFDYDPMCDAVPPVGPVTTKGS